MKYISCALCALIGIVVISSCSPAAPKVVEKLTHSDTLLAFKIRSRAVRAGKLDSAMNVEIFVQLPPSYASSRDKKYPVIYAMNGFSDSALALITPINRVLLEDRANTPEVILVTVEGTNSLGGSFFANSPATGNWEDLVAKEAVALVDKRFRTIKGPEGRMLAGFSMGGNAAWNLALAHPDVFGAAWACCPGAWDENGMRDTLKDWAEVYRVAYSAAYSPDLSLPKPYGRIPKFDGSPGDEAIQADWERGFGGISGKLAAYAAGTARLRAVHFAYGRDDGYPWIPRGTRYVANAMKEAGIPVEIREFKVGHVINNAMLRESLLPLVRSLY